MPKMPAAQAANFLSPPARLGVLLGRAQQAERERDPDRAAGLYQHILSLDPLNIPASEGLGALYVRCVRVADALRLFENQTRIQPQNPRVWWALGKTLFDYGEFRPALSCFDNIIMLDPAFPDIHVFRADTLFHMGAFADAAAVFEALALVDDRALVGLGAALKWCGRFGAAHAAFDKAIARHASVARLNWRRE